MDQSGGSRNFVGTQDICSQAKQRATMKWLLSKAYNNRIPENFIEPFYKDYDNQEHLKPSLVHLLANAEIYCLALGNIYSDPNYHNINHCSILQILNKKGIIVNDSSVTETILIQTTPLKIAAHITIIEAIMALFFKEVTTPNKIVDAIQRFNLVPNKLNIVMPENNERSVLLWINSTIEALKNRLSNSQKENSSILNIAFVNDFSELSDGVAIAALIYFYCPNELPWQYVNVSNTPTSSDCIQNFSVINDFCDRSLPFKIFHMRPQDVYYIRGPMKINLIAFFADLFNALEINPAKCVSFNHGVKNLTEASPRNIHGVSYKRFLPEKNSIIPQLRSNLDSDSTMFTVTNNTHNNPVKKNLNKTNQKLSDGKIIDRDDQFVVHHNRSVLTLNSMLNGCNVDAQNIAAGIPTPHEKKQSYAGRRSRKNSFSDESQLTVENFGGSQDNLHFLGRNPDKQPAIHIGHNSINRIVNSHSQENDSSGVQNLLQDNIQDTCISPSMSRGFIDTSNNSQGLQRMLYDSFDEFETVPTLKRSLSFVDTTQYVADKTTWIEQNSPINNDNDDSENDGSITSSQLLNIKLKLEEKRRQIENDKRKMESLMNRQRQAVGKAAFLQAVSKSKNDNRNSQSPDLNYSNRAYSTNVSPTPIKNTQTFSLQNNGIHNKWSDRMNSFTDDGKVPGYLNEKKYNTLSRMHLNYKEMQADLQYLNSQQKDIQHNSLQSEIQQDYHNSHNNQQPNYLMNFHQNNCVSPNEQIIQHGIIYEQNQSLSNQQSLPVLNNYDHTTFQEPYINQIHSNSSSPINNYYLHGYSDQIMQSNMEKQPQQFFLHSEKDQNFKSSLDNIPSSQTHTFDKNSQNVWNYGRTITQSPTHLLPRQKSECKVESTVSPIPPRRNYNNHIANHSQMPTLSIDNAQLQHASIGNNTKTSELNLSEHLNRIQITSGHRTYRIPSPTRTHRPIHQNSFNDYNTSPSKTSQDTTDNISDKGFYVSFEDKETPKRPKPPLRKKKIISKERNLTQVLNNSVSLNNLDISSNSTPINHVKTKEISSPINHVTETTVLPISSNNTNHSKHLATSGVELIIENTKPDPVILNEMEKKKEKIILLSLKRRQNQEELKNKKELEIQKKKDDLRLKEEMKKRKKIEEKERRAMILEQYRLKKMIEEAEKDGKPINKELLNSLKENNSTIGQPKLRNKIQSGRPRPKTIHVDCSDTTHGTLPSSKRNKALNSQIRRDYYRGSQDCLTETRRTSVSSIYSDGATDEEKCKPKNLDGTNKNYRDSSLDKSKHKTNFGSYTNQPRKSSSLMNLYGISNCDQYSLLYQYGDTDSGLGRATPPRRAASPCGPGSLPIRRKFDDAVSESGSDYTGPKLYKQPVIKSNRGIILNAVEYCVFPGVVNRENKKRVLDEINRSGARHFLILFRDTGCQFRALYLYYPETEEVVKLYGTGPRIVNDCMFDRFFKYNSGGKCFSQVHTRHLTVTIDAFTIHNSLWQGKKVNYPNKKDMTLVI